MTYRLTEPLHDLIRLAATDLPKDVQTALTAGVAREAEQSSAADALKTILENVRLAKARVRPMCQDTGTPLFFVRHPETWSQSEISAAIRQAVATATEQHYLRPNAVDPLTGVNSGNNLGGEYFPFIHYETRPDTELVVDLVLKGGGCENVGAQYALPDERLGAMRDLEGVYRVVMDAVLQAQGQGCAPGVLGVIIGGDRGSAYLASKQLYLRKLGDRSANPHLAALEERILRDANRLGIGPMGFGGETTLLDVFAGSLHSLPASYFVTISYMCWAFRRKRLLMTEDGKWRVE